VFREVTVLYALKHGTAVVKNPKTGEFVPYININYFGSLCGSRCGTGLISVYLPEEDRPFFTVDWWVS